MLDYLFGFRSFQQFCALYRKNALVAWRNRRATILRILAPFLFLLLALLIDKAIQANDRNQSDFKSITSPVAELVDPIPQCSDDLLIQNKGTRNCVEVLYSPNTNAAVNDIMAAVRDQNTKKIAVEGMATRSDIQTYLLNNPDTVLGAVHFEFDGPGNINGFVLQVNTSRKYFKGQFQSVNMFMQLPLQSAVQREIARYMLKQGGSQDEMGWTAATKTFAHPTIATTSVLGQVLGPFVFAACMFSFVTQIGTVVQEKELGLKQAMRTMGMTDLAYWASWGLWEVTLAFFIAHSICIFGLILQFSLFLDNNYGLLFFLFFLFQLAMSSLALVLVAFVRRTQVAVYLGFLVFIIGWIMQSVVIFGVPYTPDYFTTAGSAVTVIFSLFPWDLLAKGFTDLGSATVSSDSPGISWSQRDSYCRDVSNPDERPSYDKQAEYIDFECVMSLNSIYWALTALWLGYFLLAMWLDNVIPNEHGVCRPVFYFLYPRYWFPKCFADHSVGRKLDEVERTMKDTGEGPVTLDQDVREEEARVKALAHHRTGAPGEMASRDGEVEKSAASNPAAAGATGAGGRNAIEVYGLQKLYRGSRGCCGTSVKCCSMCDCCSCEVTSDFWAIKGSWFSIPQGQLFCLLGPNGAGKTTTINCLTGVIPPTHGEALVYGEALSAASGIDSIRSMMGVCPQFDVLWGELTGAEHLSIYGHMKGLPWRKVAAEAELLLEKVKLTGAAAQRSSAYSGGMRRRLSVAIALLGDPKIVYLDEPTTGMDPISRRYVWDIIQEAKKGRVIVLTTHSMEEADILGDRIAIMARGRLRCIGSSLRLKQRFGSGYSLAISVLSARGSQDNLAALASRAQGVKDWVAKELGLSPMDETRAYMHFLVPRSRESEMVAVLKRLEGVRQELGVTDVQLSLTSLEEVFLSIARQAEVEAAASSGQGEVAYVLPDGKTLQIPMGAELVRDATTGAAYRIRWGTDETGSLVIMDCVLMPPPDQQAPVLASATMRTAQMLAAAGAFGPGVGPSGRFNNSYTAPVAPPVVMGSPVPGSPGGSNAATMAALAQQQQQAMMQQYQQQQALMQQQAAYAQQQQMYAQQAMMQQQQLQAGYPQQQPYQQPAAVLMTSGSGSGVHLAPGHHGQTHAPERMHSPPGNGLGQQGGMVLTPDQQVFQQGAPGGLAGQAPHVFPPGVPFQASQVPSSSEADPNGMPLSPRKP